MTNQRRSRFLDVLTADDDRSLARVLETGFWRARTDATEAKVIDLAARRRAHPGARFAPSRAS
ncbi:MAG: hypothetical protein HYV09_09840 [Deltaproteobacteria bacterium]|nr:hypothetical protein [Deltaproteobacteria bacterium]